MLRRTALSVAAVLALLGMANGAQAQKAGTYSGTSADGGNISLTITGSEPFMLSNMNVNFMGACKNGEMVSEGWGFFLGMPVDSSGIDFLSHNDYYYIDGNLRFPNSNTVKGSITSRTAVFVASAAAPMQATYCKSAKQAFTLKYQGPAIAQTLGGAVVLP
jgi:hypothetical protein